MNRNQGLGVGGIVILGLLILPGIVWVPEQLRSHQQAEAAKIRCQVADDTAACLAGIEKWAGPCFRQSFLTRSRHGALTSRAITDEGRRYYDHCLRNGPESVLELRAAEGKARREAEKDRDKQLDGVMKRPY